ncbi:uncharacterized protein K02A2.6-like [Neodiprion lecontei]|uniref:RNA-directed DNA polymerase n=1 Tax=Neodiprion lecontei TaxID=441921 RepID=A0ABM3GME0_NEOLC|nr:uncharacterized protein K02A2.6-like [Neodiprion lecontei]XP_046601434.1 uncharacterized protein K02A2.6-like [Neodiprion lecontei]
MANEYRGVPPMSMTDNVGENWRTWRARFENYLVASEANKKSEATQCAQLLHYIGEDGFKIFTTFTIPDEEKDKLQPLIKKFEEHFLPKENLAYERYQFFSYRQRDGETLEQFITELKKKAKKCKLGSLNDELIKTMITCGVADGSIREKLLQNDEQTLQEAIDRCLIIEKSKERSQEMEHALTTTASVDAIKGRSQRTDTAQHTYTAKSITSCTKCGYTHAINRCPAYNKICNNCRKKNHFAEMCFKKQYGNERDQKINEINEDSDHSEYLFIAQVETSNVKERWYAELVINNHSIEFKIDTGADVNILPMPIFKKINIAKKEIQRTNTKLNCYSGETLNVVGKCNVMCHRKGQKHEIEFFVIDSNGTPLLGRKTSEEINLVKRIYSVEQNSYNELRKQYEDVFSGIGCLSKPYQIKLKKNATPVIHPTRRVPLPLRDTLKQALDKLEKDKIIEKKEGPSEWVNALVLVRKPNGSIRICIDPKEINKQIEVEPRQIPTFEEIISRANGATVFSKLDAQAGFYHVPLDEKSSEICTFGTPFGRYKFRRMPFGIKTAPEVFQDRFKQIFDLEGVEVYIDDIFVYGKTKKEHDIRLKEVLDAARQNGVRFNIDKCELGKKQIKYIGHIISENGIAPDSTKIEAIKKLPVPQNKKELQRILGMLTYVSKFVVNFAEKTAPLRNVLKKDGVFEWNAEQQRAFDQLKACLSSAPVLQFFDVNKETTLSVDASQAGLGAVLLQNRLPCAYAAKAMTDTQTRYAQIEKELLAVCFGLERFHDYIYGKKIVVETDHKPLIPIFQKPLNKCPGRLQRMLVQIQKYDIEIVYRPGKELYIADALSRAYDKNDKFLGWSQEIESQVCSVNYVNATPEKIKQLIESTEKDSELKALKEIIQNGWPNNSNKLPATVRPYAQYKSELVIVDGLVFKNDCLVIPREMRNEIIDRIHYSHQGITKYQKIARESVFWPGISNQVKQKIGSCPICLKYSNSQNRELLQPHEIPELPWNKIACDMYEINGQKYLLVVDYYSKYLEIAELRRNATSENVIRHLKTMFASHGVPVTIVSDGGTQFTSQEFKKFAKEWEFDHVTSSPTYAQSNGMAERHIQTFKKKAKKIMEERKDVQMALLQYRNTPVIGNRSPAELLMSRKLRDNLPKCNEKFLPKVVPNNIKKMIVEEQNKQTEYYNRRGAKNLPEIPDNTDVYAQLQPNSLWQPAKVISQTGNRRYSIQTKTGNILTRNRRFLKPFKKTMAKNKPPSSPLVANGDNKTYYIPLDDETNSQTDDTETNSDSEGPETAQAVELNDRSIAESQNGTESDQSVIIVDTSTEADETWSEAVAMPTATIAQSGRESKPPSRLQIE